MGTSKGVVKARDVYRRTLSERFDVETLKTIVGVSWLMTPTQETDAGEIPEFRVVPASERSPGDRTDQIGNQLPRRVKMAKDVMDKYGRTPQCLGCINLRIGKYHRPHLESCRRRIEDLMNQDTTLRHRIQAAAARQDAWTVREQTPGTPETIAGITGLMEGRDLVVHTPPLGEVSDVSMGGAGTD